MTMLENIVRHKKAALREIDAAAQIAAVRDALPYLQKAVSLADSLKKDDGISIIAEIKRRSPSRGDLATGLSVETATREYETGGARAVSVLTDHYFFGGGADDLMAAKHNSRLPILRKDFIISEYQIWESRLIGADAILLIAAILTEDEMARFYALAGRLGLEVLIEVHARREIDMVRSLDPAIIGINNRDLASFTVDLATTERLRPYLPDHAVCVSESGIRSREDMMRLRACGVDAVLIGESLVTSPHPAETIRHLLGVRHDTH